MGTQGQSTPRLYPHTLSGSLAQRLQVPRAALTDHLLRKRHCGDAKDCCQFDRTRVPGQPAKRSAVTEKTT